MTVKLGAKRIPPAVNREADASASSPPGGELPLTSREIRTTRLLMWITAGSSFVLALVCVVAFQLLLYFLRGQGPSASAGTAECYEGQSPDPCIERGQVCIASRCVDDLPASPLRCQVNDPCGAPENCVCESPLACAGGRCMDPEQAQATSPVCQEAEVLEVLRQLHAKCAGDFATCKGSDLEKFVIGNPDFDRLMAKFPGTITLHFPDNKPPLGAGSAAWPEGSMRDYYVSHLLSSVPELRAARHIFVIARSSPGGGTLARNRSVARDRGKLAKQFLLAALVTEDNTSTADTDAIRAKFMDFVLGPDKPIGIELYGRLYANRMVAWDEKHETRLRALLAPGVVTTPADAIWRDRVINQVVFIVPVPCALDGAD